MNIFTEKGIVLKFDNNKVFIKLYPKTDLLIEVKRETALHLYKLINKYNYTIRDSKKWSTFWRNITQLERTMTVLFFKANNLDKFGYKFYLENVDDLPDDFKEITTKSRLNKITDKVLNEFSDLHKVYVKSIVDKEEVKRYWEKEYSNTCNIIKKHNQFQRLVDLCFEEEKVREIFEQVLTKEGKSSFEKPNWTEDYDEETFDFLVKNESSIFANTADMLAGWKDND